MTDILTTAAGVLLAAYIYRNMRDSIFRKHLFVWWVIIPFFILLGLFILGSTPSKASSTLGLGVTPCVEFARDYRKDPKATRMLYYTWFAGFVSGINIMSDRQKNVRVDFDARWAQLARYCNEHPLGYFYDAAKFVVLDLPYEDDNDKPPITNWKQVR